MAPAALAFLAPATGGSLPGASRPCGSEPRLSKGVASSRPRFPAISAAGLTVCAGAVAAKTLLRSRRCRRGGRAAVVALRASEDATAITEAKETKVVKRELTDRQQQFWEMLEEDFEEDVVPEFGRENLLRVYEFIKYCKYEQEIPELPEMQEIDPEFFPGLRANPWWEVDDIDKPEWVEQVVAGLPYVQGELADLLEDNEEYLISDSVQNDVMGGGWSGFRLRRLGTWLSRNCELFPKTVQLLKQSEVPLAMRGVIVARQAPGTGVQPHSDGRNFFLTAHFGLSVPPDCSITVGGEERPWKEDDCIILDTSFLHETKNESDEDRFVLVVDFWHPDLTIPEREALEWIYDFRNKFEQGKIKYVPKLPDGFWETLYVYSAWGGAYTEENVQKQPIGPDTLGGFRLGKF
mmetsp:Transcript_52084/g.121504  ORF Transcript_52084/g.121504 Transcript_52084/m.121504 type:complete len:407 (-) Transcript_52084:163-1383(-)